MDTIKSINKFIIDKDTIPKAGTYNDIMNSVWNTDVSKDVDSFQRKYNGYYIPAQKSNEFKKQYYIFMQTAKADSKLEYEAVIKGIYERTKSVEYSFSSKLLHTLHPEMPILDKHIMRLLGFPLMNSGRDEDRIRYYCRVYETVREEYEKIQNDFENGSTRPICYALREFDKKFVNCENSECANWSMAKKIDTIIFRLRNERGPSVLDF